ncbi:MAG: metalloprotease family protein [Planctomycetota bacterium]|nr:metalloprotease family protein [Planctomycetota bacterium]
MIIPGFLVSVATFPGVIVHEAAHMFFCKLRRVAVLDVCFFRLGNPAGYVLHEKIEDFNTAFLVSVGPFLVNSLLCMFICFPVFVPYEAFGISDPLIMLHLWLGVSIGMHAFPSPEDGSSLWKQASKAARELNPLAILSYPLVVLIYIAHALSFFWFDAIYGFFIGIGLPMILLANL